MNILYDILFVVFRTVWFVRFCPVFFFAPSDFSRGDVLNHPMILEALDRRDHRGTDTMGEFLCDKILQDLVNLKKTETSTY